MCVCGGGGWVGEWGVCLWVCVWMGGWRVGGSGFVCLMCMCKGLMCVCVCVRAHVCVCVKASSHQYFIQNHGLRTLEKLLKASSHQYFIQTTTHHYFKFRSLGFYEQYSGCLHFLFVFYSVYSVLQCLQCFTVFTVFYSVYHSTTVLNLL
jgi:hypothetical protein